MSHDRDRVAKFDSLEGVFAVDEGDEVNLAVDDYEWANPYDVVDINHVEWRAANENVWATRKVIIEGGYGSTFSVSAVEGDDDLELRKHPGCQKRGDLERSEPVDEDESGISTEDGTSISDVGSESEAEAHHVDLEEEAADDAPDDAGDDVQEAIEAEDITVDDVEDGEFECDCGQPFESQAAYQGHGPRSCEGGDEESVELPDGVTEDLVDELTSGRIEIGELAEELDVHRNRARTIAFELGFYKRVREVWRDRERAQVDPRVAGLLVVALGLAFTGVLTVGAVVP